MLRSVMLVCMLGAVTIGQACTVLCCAIYLQHTHHHHGSVQVADAHTHICAPLHTRRTSTTPGRIPQDYNRRGSGRCRDEPAVAQQRLSRRVAPPEVLHSAKPQPHYMEATNGKVEDMMT